MARNNFYDKAKKLARKKGLKSLSKKAVNFFRDKVKSLFGKEGKESKKFLKSRKKDATNPSNMRIGKMYFYMYDPKYKKTLPYYDKFPLIFLLKRSKTVGGKGFLGINLHYLAPRERAIFLGKLLELTNNDKMDETTRLRISYALLKNSSNMKEFKPTIKRYLNRHLQSRIIEIPPEDWMTVTFLPLAQFAKESSQKVWSDSKKMIKG